MIRKAADLAGEEVDDLDAIRQLGQGLVGDEALAIAIYCCLKYSDDLRRALISAVNHSGDSDSTGAIAGNILGAYLGYEAIPDEWIQKIELQELILKEAEDISKVADYANKNYIDRRSDYL